MCGGEVEEHVSDAFELAAARLQRRNGVGEGRLRTIAGDRVHLGAVAVHGGRERGREVLRLDLAEGGRP